MTSDARRVSNARGATRIWATPTYGQKEDDYVVNNLATFRFGDPGAVDDDGHDPGPTHNPTQHRSHQSQQQQTILLSHHAELPSMSPIRSPISFNEFGEHSDDDDSYNDNISAYDYDSDGFDTESALRIEVGSAQFDDQSLIEGPALAGTWGPSSSSTSIRTVHTYSSSSQSRRRSRSWSSYSRTSSSSNDWRRLLGPVDMSTTTVATPPEFVSTYSPTDDETPYTHAVPQEPQIPPDPDAMSGYNLQFITQDFSSPLDFVSKSHQHQQDQARRRSSYRTSTLPLPIHPSPSTPPDSNRPLPVLPALQQLRRDSASVRSARPLSIQSARTTGTFSLDDSFQRGLMTWGGEDYGTLRREWVIKKDKENNMYQNQNQRYPSQVWTGMFPGDDEVWANYWLGNFLVSREDVPSGSSSRPSQSGHTSKPSGSQHRSSGTSSRDTERDALKKDKSQVQQRLVIRKLKDESTPSAQPKSSQSPVSGYVSGSANSAEKSASTTSAGAATASVSAIASSSSTSSTAQPVSADDSASEYVSTHPSSAAFALTHFPGSIHPVAHEHEHFGITSVDSNVTPSGSGALLSSIPLAESLPGASTSSFSSSTAPELVRVISSSSGGTSHGSINSGSHSGSGSGSQSGFFGSGGLGFGSSSSVSGQTHRSVNTNVSKSSSNNAASSISTKGRPKVNSDTRHPPVIVHKHSKVVAFSISRHFRSGTTGGVGGGGGSVSGGKNARNEQRSGLSPSSAQASSSRDRERGSREQEREREAGRGKDRGRVGDRDREKGNSVRRSQVVMLAARPVQGQFYGAHSEARNTKNLLVGAGLAMDKRGPSERQKDKEKEKEKEKERISKGKGKEREREREREKEKEKEKKSSKSPQIGAKTPPSVARQKSADSNTNRNGSGEGGSTSGFGSIFSPLKGSGLSPTASGSSNRHYFPEGSTSSSSSSKGTRSMPERASKGFEGMDLAEEKKQSQSLSALKAAKYEEEMKERPDTLERQEQLQQQRIPQQRPTRPRLRSLVQPQQSRSSPTTQTQQQEAPSPQVATPSQSKSLLRRLFLPSSSSSSASSSATSSISSKQAVDVTASVGSIGSGNEVVAASAGYSAKSGNTSVSTSSTSTTVAATATPLSGSSLTLRDEEVQAQAQQRKILYSLEESFENIGLLPSGHERLGRDSRERTSRAERTRDSVASSRDQGDKKKSSSKGLLGRKKVVEDETSTDVLSSIPPETLFMVLPLWPGETDMYSQQKARSFVPPEIPEEEKRYLVVYYKTRPTITEEDIVRGGGGKQKQKQKEREKESEPTPGSDQAKNIMLSSFIVVALTVSFEELQDLRVTLPKEGLMVTGPLEDAFRSIPPKTRRDSSSDVSVRECVLAQCNSRDTGLQFDPEALIQLGLCSVVRETAKEPLPLGRVSEEFDSQKTIEVKLTSLGTAVMEMIWYGGLALTSFGAE